MAIASNKIYFTSVPWEQNIINLNWFFIQPENKTLHLGDGLMTAYADRVDYLHARVFSDPRSLWRAQFWSLPANTPNTSANKKNSSSKNPRLYPKMVPTTRIIAITISNLLKTPEVFLRDQKSICHRLYQPIVWWPHPSPCPSPVAIWRQPGR